jgi:hypothetical protein
MKIKCKEGEGPPRLGRTTRKFEHKRKTWQRK